MSNTSFNKKDFLNISKRISDILATARSIYLQQSLSQTLFNDVLVLFRDNMIVKNIAIEDNIVYYFLDVSEKSFLKETVRSAISILRLLSFDPMLYQKNDPSESDSFHSEILVSDYTLASSMPYDFLTMNDIDLFNDIASLVLLSYQKQINSFYNKANTNESVLKYYKKSIVLEKFKINADKEKHATDFPPVSFYEFDKSEVAKFLKDGFNEHFNVPETKEKQKLTANQSETLNKLLAGKYLYNTENKNGDIFPPITIPDTLVPFANEKYTDQKYTIACDQANEKTSDSTVFQCPSSVTYFWKNEQTEKWESYINIKLNDSKTEVPDQAKLPEPPPVTVRYNIASQKYELVSYFYNPNSKKWQQYDLVVLENSHNPIYLYNKNNSYSGICSYSHNNTYKIYYNIYSRVFETERLEFDMKKYQWVPINFPYNVKDIESALENKYLNTEKESEDDDLCKDTIVFDSLGTLVGGIENNANSTDTSPANDHLTNDIKKKKKTKKKNTPHPQPYRNVSLDIDE